MILTKDKIEKIIPQQKPFVMIDHLSEAEGDTIISGFTVTDDNIFLEQGILREFALIENIAQTCAAGLMFIRPSKNSEGKKVDGYIGAISKLHLFELPGIGEKITTKVILQNEFENMYLLKGEIFSGEKLLLEGEFKIAAK